MLSKRQYTGLVLVTLCGSFAGSAAMEWLLTGKAARAGQAGNVGGRQKVVRAERFEAREFRVVDMHGKLRAGFTVGPYGEPYLLLRDKDGKPGAYLGAPGGSPILALYDKDGNERAWLMLADGSPGLVLTDKDGKVRADLRATADGSPYLSLCDKNGNQRAVLGCTSLHDKRTQSTKQRQESSLVLLKSDGDVLWQAP